MRILRADQHKRMPWKNGGGETVEIAVFPEDAGLSDFDWRVSMARVDDDGPFSSFPGIDRTLAVLEGAGIVLDVEDSKPKALTQASEPHAFPADLPTSARLIDGAVVDFNVMSRRGKFRHLVMRLRSNVGSGGARRLLLCSHGPISVAAAGETVELGRFDAALLDRNEYADVTVGRRSEYYLVEFREHGQAPASRTN